MVMDEVFARFMKHSPVCVMVQAVLEHTFGAPKIDAVFERTATSPYTGTLLLSTVVEASWYR